MSAGLARSIASTMSRTYARLGSGFGTLKGNLNAGFTASMGVVGDSTGAGTTRWVALFAAYLAGLYPTRTVQYRNFTTGTTTYDTAPVVVQTGAAGARYVTLDGTTATGLSYPSLTANRIVGDIDLRAKVQVAQWAPGVISNRTILAKFGAGGARSLRFQLLNNGKLSFDWTSDGSTILGPATSSVAVPFADGTAGWVRVTFDVDNGAAGRDAKFYTSTDGVTWTQLGTTQTSATATSIFDSTTQPWEIGARGSGGGEFFGGQIYTVEVRDTIGGPIVTPVWPDQWAPVNSNWNGVFSGAPVLDIWNGSWSGAALGTQLIPNVNQLCPSVGMSALVVNDGHNEGGKDPIEFTSSLATLLTSMKARNPLAGVVLMGQNPKTSPGQAQYLIDAHAKRQVILPGWARANGYSATDVYSRFNTSALGLSALVQSDGVHPVDGAGTSLWESSVEALWAAASGS